MATGTRASGSSAGRTQMQLAVVTVLLLAVWPGPSAAQGSAGMGQPIAAPSDSHSGAIATWTFSFTVSRPWIGGDRFEVTFPMSFHIASVGTVLIDAQGRTESAASGVSGNLVTVVRGAFASPIPSGVGVAVRIAGIANPPAALSTGTFAARTVSQGGAALDGGTFPAVEILPSTLAALQGTASNLETGGPATYVVRLNTTNPWPTKGFLRFAFPSTYGLADVVASDAEHSACLQGESLTMTRQGSLIFFRRPEGPACPAGTQFTIALAGLQNPSGAARNESVEISTADESNRTIDRGNVSFALVSALTNIAYETSNEESFGLATVSIAMRLNTTWPTKGALALEFPTPAFNISGASAQITGPCDIGVMSTARNVPLGSMELTRAGGTPCAEGSQLVVTVNGIRNPRQAGVYGAVELATRSGPRPLDHGATPPVTIVPSLADGFWETSNSSAGAPIVLTGNLSWASSIQAGDQMSLEFPPGYHFTQPGLALESDCNALGHTSILSSVNPLVLTTTFNTVDDCPDALALRVVLGGITNPPSAAAETYSPLRLRSRAGALLAFGQSHWPETIGGNMTSVMANPSTTANDTDALYAFDLVMANPLPADAKFDVAFPTGYQFGSVAGALTGGTCRGTLALLERDGGNLSFRRTGGASCEGRPTTALEVTGVRNPVAMGPTGMFGITARTGSGAVIESAIVQGVEITDMSGNTLPGPVRLVRSAEALQHPQWSRGRSGTFEWNPPLNPGAGAPFRYQATLDSPLPPSNASNTIGITGFTFSGLSEGEHVFRVRAVDKAGREGATTEYRFRVDSVPPTKPSLSSTTHPEASQCRSAAIVDVAWPVPGDGRSGLRNPSPYTYRVDSGPEVPLQTNRANVSGLADGAHVIHVRVYDAAGNHNESLLRFTVDRTAAQLSLRGPAYANGPFHVSWEASDACGRVIKVRVEMATPDDGEFKQIMTGLSKRISVEPTSEGRYRFLASALDAAGNRNASTDATASVVVDLTPPKAPAAEKIWNNEAGGLDLTWSAPGNDTSGIAGYIVEWSRDGIQYHAGDQLAARQFFHFPTGPGDDPERLGFRVRAVDGAGNVGEPSGVLPAANASATSYWTTTAEAVETLANVFSIEANLPLRAIDTDSDGEPDVVEDLNGLLNVSRLVKVGGRTGFLITDAARNRLGLWFPTMGDAHPVSRIEGTVEAPPSETSNETWVTPLMLEPLEGWVDIRVPLRPGPNWIFDGVHDAAGATENGSVSLENGTLMFLVKNPTSYSIAFARSGAPASGESTTAWPPGTNMLAGLAAGLAGFLMVGAAGVVVWRRRRLRAQSAAPPDPAP